MTELPSRAEQTERSVLGVLARRQVPTPRCPAPGPLDVALGLLLARAAPFHRPAQTALYRRLGWPAGEPATRRRAQLRAARSA